MSKSARETALELVALLGIADAFKVAQGRERWAKSRKEFWGTVQAEIARIKLAGGARR